MSYPHVSTGCAEFHTLVADGPMADVLYEVREEREEQDLKWGQQNHPDIVTDTTPGNKRRHYAKLAQRWKQENATRASDGCLAWDGILFEEVYEALAEADPAKLRAELVQVAAVAVAWVEAIDRRTSVPGSGFTFTDSHTGKRVES
jgi:hypothetical protein